MKVTTERLDNCQVNVIIELDASEIDKKLRQTARKLARDFNIPGYRPGRAPYHAVVRTFGREAVQQQALDDFGNELYDQALEEIDYEPYDMGDLQEVEWEPFRMTVQIPIPPEVELGDYRSVRVPFEPEEITDEAIEEYLEDMREEHAQWVPVERPAQMGDEVVLDIKGTTGDHVMMDNENSELILEEGATYPMPGLHEQVVGMPPGQEKVFELEVPESDSDEAAAGKTATVTVHLHTVRERDVPPVDDELAMMVGDYESLDDLKASVRERLETEALEQAESEYLNAVLEAMLEAAERIEYPPQAVDREADLSVSQMERSMAAQGLPPETLWRMMGKSRESYMQDIRSSAEQRLRRRLILDEVARQEGLEPEPEEVDAEIELMVEMAGPEASQMREMLETPQGRASITQDLVISMAQERVKEIGRGEAPPLEEKPAPDAAVEAEPEEPAEDAAPEADSGEGQEPEQSEAGAS
ncbi:MAG: trigger factor [Anaerolineae bacterium]|nr:trigger factor [Anaerolineae bacterium]